MIQGHGGNVCEMAKVLGCLPGEILDMSSNVRPLGMPSGLKAMLGKRWEEIAFLAEVDSERLQVSFTAFLSALSGSP